MNTPATIPRGPEQTEIDIGEILKSVWKQRAIVLLFSGLGFVAAITYVTLATPEYEVNTSIRPVSNTDLDELNESGVYKILPEAALHRIGSLMESYDVRLSFFKAYPQYLTPLQAPGESIEQSFESFNGRAFTLTQTDPKKSASLSSTINLTLKYPKGVDGVGIVKDFTAFVVNSEKEKIKSNVKTLVSNRIEKIEQNLDSKKSAYAATTSSSIAGLLEKDNIKKQTLQDELKALRQQLQSRRQNRIKELDEAIVIAKQLGIVKPTTPSSLADMGQTREGNMIRTEVTNQQIPLYFMGQSALEAERSTLVSRRSDDFTEPRIDEIQKELSLLAVNRKVGALMERENAELFLDGIGDIRADLTRLKNLNISFDQFELVHIDKAALEPQSAVYPKKTKIVGAGILFGLALGIAVALLRRLFPSFQANRINVTV
ncbi:Wzz/FepE/Etk N-terminal domain-containing protein [Pseudomonas sp. RT6P73]